MAHPKELYAEQLDHAGSKYCNSLGGTMSGLKGYPMVLYLSV